MDLNLNSELSPHLQDHLHKELVKPAREFMSRSSKSIRRQLVATGHHWVRGEFLIQADRDHCEALGMALELIHSASLIIDDIQDQSPMRRGAEAMHITLGVPKAINLANWLYFKGFEQIDQLQVSEKDRLTLLRLFRRALLQGHVGQALDLGLPISRVPREQVPGVVEASVRLKTGALTGLAFAAGAILGGVEEDRIETAYSLGEEIGVVLQFLDDLKNLKVDPLAANKQYEDFQNQRPSLVWMLAAEDSDERCWSELIGAVEELPDQRPVKQWILDHRIIPLALHRIEERMQQLRSRFARPSDIAGILQQLVNAYEQI